MKIDELLKEENFLSKALDTIWSGPKNDELINWIKDNIRQRGTQWIYRNVDKQFPKRYVRSDVDDALKIVLGR